MEYITCETVDQDTADQVLNSFKILAGDKVRVCVHVCVCEREGEGERGRSSTLSRSLLETRLEYVEGEGGGRGRERDRQTERDRGRETDRREGTERVSEYCCCSSFMPCVPCSCISHQTSYEGNCLQIKLNIASSAWLLILVLMQRRELWITCPFPLPCMGRASSSL